MGNIITKQKIGNKAFEAVVPKHLDLRNATKDHDKDGVMSVIDCQPHNPKEQGIIHRIGAAALNRLGADKAAERIEQRGEAVDEARADARVERAKQMKETAVFREQERGKQQREFIAKGGRRGAAIGILSGLGKGIQSVAANTRQSPITTTRRVKIKKGKGKGKFRNVTSTSTPKPQGTYGKGFQDMKFF